MTTISYSPMTCRFCEGQVIAAPAEVDRRPTASSYATCVYKCDVCEVGYSNTSIEAARTAIWKNPLLNVPEAYRDHLAETIAAALNENSRTSKKNRVGFSTSEDAVTWTIFRWLEESDALDVLTNAADIKAPSGTPEVLWWGVPRGGSVSALSTELAGVCLELGENPKSLSEPDLVLSWRSNLVFVEVNYRAPNERKPDYKNFDTYTSGLNGQVFADPAKARQEGWYELSRNWVIGARLAEANGQAFTLVNLAPGFRKKSADEFEATIVQAPRLEFRFLDWKTVLGRARADGRTMPPAVEKFIAERGLEGRWG